MHPRYFITYRRWDGKTVQSGTYAFGRFRDQIEAERKARECFSRPGSEVISVRPETSGEAARHKICRFFARTLRVVFAVAIGFVVYLLIGYAGFGIGDIPLKNLTLSMIFSALIRGMLILGAAWFCWVLVFGEGPRDE